MLNSPLPDREQERVGIVEQYLLLHSLEDVLEQFTQLASITCQCAVSLISFIGREEQLIKTETGTGIGAIPWKSSFCKHTIFGREVLEVEDVGTDSRFVDHPLATRLGPIRFYAGQPLIDPDGFALGTLCVMDVSPKKLSGQQKTALKILGDQVVDFLIRQKNDALPSHVKNVSPAMDEKVGNRAETTRREQILIAISEATDELLSNYNFYKAIYNSLELIGEAVDVHRLHFFENGFD